MPSSKKILYFISSAVSTAVSVGLLGFGMSQEWSTTTVLCARDGTDEFNGTAAVTMGLFNGSLFRDNCPGFKTTGGAPPALHFLSVILLALCLLFSAGSILLSLYNSVSNPYQTCMGYVGVYACSSLSACLSVLVLILFVINVSVTNLAEVVLSADESINILRDIQQRSIKHDDGDVFREMWTSSLFREENLT
uniref:Clarin 3 n=1 Tax=Oryzias latipes TaxID=8090 RepID=A0A3B3H2S6_ORYLA